MKEATGELNMTVITIVAIAAIAAFFTLFIYPKVKDKLLKNVDASGDTLTATSQANCTAQCKNRGFSSGKWTSAGESKGTCTCSNS